MTPPTDALPPKPLRTGRLGRIAGMARAGAGLALGTFTKDPVAPLARAADTLAELRGLATKAGQMAGIWSAMLPPEERAKAEPILARLRASTATSDPSAIRALVEAELGMPVSEAFARFDERPFASASLGQVHRAVLPDALGGLEVAVKVQHPGIDAALAADLDNAARMGGIAAVLAVPTAGAMVDEVRARLEEELDYTKEAAWQSRFATLFASDEVIRIPRIVAERCTRRVLTSELVHGLRVDEAARLPTAHAQAQAIRRFVRTAWLEQGLLFADPHAGNWIFHEEGHVTVLDFGSVLRFDEPTRAKVQALLDVIGTSASVRDARVLAAASAVLGLPRSPAVDLTLEMFAQALAPLAHTDRTSRQDDLAALSRLSTEAKKKMLGTRLSLPPWLPLTLRAAIGLTALLIELEA